MEKPPSPLTWISALTSPVSATPTMCGGPKTTLRFSDLPEGLKGLRKAVILISWFIIVKACRWKSAQGRGNEAESRRNQAQASLCVLLVELQRTQSILLAKMCDNMYEGFNQGRLGVRVFTGDLSCRHTASAQLTPATQTPAF